MTAYGTIRPARLGDANTLAELMIQFYQETVTPVVESQVADIFTTFLRDERLGLAWLVDVRGRSVGYVALTFTFSLEYGGHTAFIDDLFIQRSHRGQGLGRMALATVEAAARQRGIQALHLEVVAGNHEARRLYAQVGFLESGRALMTKSLVSISS